MSRKYREYTDEDIINKSKDATSVRSLLLLLDLKPVGGNYANIKKHLQRLNVDTSHWTGQAWNKGQQLKEDWSDYSRASRLKPHVIKERGHQCEVCKLSTWLDSQIPIEIHHIDGNRSNNVSKNLQLLCPNCHAQTDNFRKPKFTE